MFDTVETEIVRAQTRLDGVDARLKAIEKKLDWHATVIISVVAIGSVLGPAAAAMLGI
tara:strand:+ start:599 stop:772 length:174 start_codon:yes stop_codon:yes gene_type:complete